MDPIQESTRDSGGLDGASSRGGYRVIVRVRPPSSDEDDEAIAVTATSRTRLRVLRSYQDPLELSFDRVFDAEAEQAEIFPVVRDVVASVVKGRSSTILAYGQTGSGKTHTMTGPACVECESAVWLSLLGEQRGIIPRTLEHLFCLTSSPSQAEAAAFRWQIHVSFMEIYNERVYDLLTGPQSRRDVVRQNTLGGREGHSQSTSDLGSLEVIESRDGTVSVPSITIVQVDSLNQVLEVLRLGTASRTYGDNGVNPTSSRSHAIFQVALEKASSVDGLVLQSAKLNLVDLAGSEKIQPTHSGSVSGVVMQELRAINLSLSTLGKCIAALVDVKRSHVPSRDSKLTRLLQDSFRGNALTAMCICIAPTASTIEETLSSLKFADRAKRAVLDRRFDPQSAGKNRSQAQVVQLLAQVNELTTELSMERAERTRLESVIQLNSSRDVSMSTVAAGSLAKGKKDHASSQGSVGLRASASAKDPRRKLYTSASCDGGIPCFGESPESTDLDVLPPRMRDVWDSDEELGQCSDHCVDGIKASPMLSCLRKGVHDFSPGESIGASSYCGSSSAKPVSHFLTRRAFAFESSPGESVEKSSYCGSVLPNNDSCKDLASCEAARLIRDDDETSPQTWSPTQKISGELAHQAQVGDHIAKIDSRLKHLTGIISDQGEELKKRLDSLEVMSAENAARTAKTLPRVPVEKPPELEHPPEFGHVALTVDEDIAEENTQQSPQKTSKLRWASLQRLRAAAEDPNLPAGELQKFIDDAKAPTRSGEPRLVPERTGQTPQSAKHIASSRDSSMEPALRAPSHPSQLPQRPQPPQRSLPPQPSELPRTARPPQPSRTPSQARASDNTSKTPPKAMPQDSRSRNGSPMPSTIPAAPARRPASNLTARGSKAKNDIHPRSRTPASATGSARTNSTRPPLASNKKSDGAPGSTSQPRNGAKNRSSSQSSVQSNAAESNPPTSPRSRLKSAFASHTPLLIPDLSAEEDEDELDFAGASVLSTLPVRGKGMASELSALAAEERKIMSELSTLSAEERRVGGNLQIAGKDERAGHKHRQQASPLVGSSNAFTKKPPDGHESPPLRSRSDWTEITGPVPCQNRPVLPWEHRGASARSNSSTSIGSTSISSRRLYAPSAPSDVSSCAGFGMRPGSDCSGSVSASAQQRRPGSASSTSASNSGSAAKRTSALEIATRCWQEFEGALGS